jgi:hypothetical protein
MAWEGKLLNTISSVLKSKTIGYREQNKLNTIDYRTIVTSKQADAIVAQAEDLINNPDFRPYFFKTLYIIGPEKFYEAMDRARSAKDPKCRPCLFVNSLKEFRNAAAPAK